MKSLALAPLFLLILLDAMGVSMLSPILTPVLLVDHPQMLPASSPAVREMVYGLSLGIYSFLMLLAAPVLGDLSDRRGRMLVLSLCIIGVLLSNLLIGVSIAFNLAGFLILGRFFGGITAGSQAVAQASALDGADPDKKAFILSMCLFTASMGFVAGPALGSVFSNKHFVSWFSYDTPLYAVACISLLNLALLFLFFRAPKPPLPKAVQGRLDLLKGIRGFAEAAKTPAIRNLALVFLLMQFAWSGYFYYEPQFLLWKFLFSPSAEQYYMSVMGVGFCIAYGLVIPLLSRSFAVKDIACASLWLTTLLLVLSVAVNISWEEWLLGLPISIAVSVGYGTIITMFSNLAGPEKQGWILGFAISVVALAQGLVSVISGALSILSPAAPLYFAAASLLAGSILLSRYNRKYSPNG